MPCNVRIERHFGIVQITDSETEKSVTLGDSEADFFIEEYDSLLDNGMSADAAAKVLSQPFIPRLQ